MTRSRAASPLAVLAAARGVGVSYTDAFSRARTVSPDTLVAVLAALGEPIAHPRDAADCLARRASRRPSAPPAVVAWDGRLAGVALPDLAGQIVISGSTGSGARLPSGAVQLVLEDGSDATELVVASPTGDVGAEALPFGCHTLSTAGSSVLVISAPVRVRGLEPWSWGLFAPTYALWDDRSTAMGDLTCLERLGRLAGSLGASYVATLPLLADYAGAGGEAAPGEAPRSSSRDRGSPLSPYSPISRMWWNEAYLDVARVPELALTATLPTRERAEPAPPRPRSSIDLAAAARHVRACLEAALDREGSCRDRWRARSEKFRQERPDVVRYAAFRAAVEERGSAWGGWPARWRVGDVVPGTDVSAATVEYHVFAQWLTDEQVSATAASTASTGCRLMLDLPIGCRPDGYDTWAFPASFAGPGAQPSGRSGVSVGVSVGAPPDAFFGEGQDWGFRPLDPEGERRAGYPVVRGSLSHLLRHAGALRIDHILGVQRLWWIPPGASARDGAYVSYPSDELVALACLEGWRRGATVIGEDLGTVDPAVRRLLGAHGIAGMKVAVFDLERRPDVRRDERPGTVAYVDTHDTATFAAWLEAGDIDERERAGLLTAPQAAAERTRRSKATEALLAHLARRRAIENDVVHDPVAVHAAVLEELGASEAGTVIATLEDLWGELDPQNIPGTTTEHANFCRRTAHALGEIEEDESVLGPLRRLERARRERAAGERARPKSGKVAS